MDILSRYRASVGNTLSCTVTTNLLVDFSNKHLLCQKIQSTSEKQSANIHGLLCLKRIFPRSQLIGKGLLLDGARRRARSSIPSSVAEFIRPSSRPSWTSLKRSRRVDMSVPSSRRTSAERSADGRARSAHHGQYPSVEQLEIMETPTPFFEASKVYQRNGSKSPHHESNVSAKEVKVTVTSNCAYPHFSRHVAFD